MFGMRGKIWQRGSKRSENPITPHKLETKTMGGERFIVGTRQHGGNVRASRGGFPLRKWCRNDLFFFR